MRRRPAPSAVLATALAAGLLASALAGCDARSAAAGDAGPPASASASAVAPVVTDPAAALRAASDKLAGQGLRFTLSNGFDRADGVYDARSRGTSVTLVRDGRHVEVDTFGTTLYLIGFAPNGGVFRLDANRLPAEHGLLPAAVPLVALPLLTGATEVSSSNADRYQGTIDLSRVEAPGDGVTRRLVDWYVKQAGDHAHEVKFKASTDRSGRLASFRATIPGADSGKDLTYELTVLEVGTTAIVGRPNGPSVVDAPPNVYRP